MVLWYKSNHLHITHLDHVFMVWNYFKPIYTICVDPSVQFLDHNAYSPGQQSRASSERVSERRARLIKSLKTEGNRLFYSLQYLATLFSSCSCVLHMCADYRYSIVGNRLQRPFHNCGKKWPSDLLCWKFWKLTWKRCANFLLQISQWVNSLKKDVCSIISPLFIIGPLWKCSILQISVSYMHLCESMDTAYTWFDIWINPA